MGIFKKNNKSDFLEKMKGFLDQEVIKEPGVKNKEMRTIKIEFSEILNSRKNKDFKKAYDEISNYISKEEIKIEPEMLYLGDLDYEIIMTYIKCDAELFDKYTAKNKKIAAEKEFLRKAKEEEEKTKDKEQEYNLLQTIAINKELDEALKQAKEACNKTLNQEPSNEVKKDEIVVIEKDKPEVEQNVLSQKPSINQSKLEESLEKEAQAGKDIADGRGI